MTEICSGCGRPISRTESLSRIHTVVLRTLYVANRPIDSKKQDWTFSERTNGQKLKYWDLMESDSRGMWCITQNGKDFVEGKSRAYKTVLIRITKGKGEVDDCLGGLIDFSQLEHIENKTQEEYHK